MKLTNCKASLFVGATDQNLHCLLEKKYPLLGKILTFSFSLLFRNSKISKFPI